MCEALTKGTAPALVEVGAHPSRARGLLYLDLLALAILLSVVHNLDRKASTKEDVVRKKADRIV